MTSINKAVNNPVDGESYPRINTTAIFRYLRINTTAFTHKHYRIYASSPYTVSLSEVTLYLYLYIKPVVSCALMWTTLQVAAQTGLPTTKKEVFR